MQTAQRESLHDRKRVEVKEFEKKLAKAKAKVEMAQQLYKARLGDELKMARNDLSDASENNPQRQMNERILSLDEA